MIAGLFLFILSSCSSANNEKSLADAEKISAEHAKQPVIVSIDEVQAKEIGLQETSPWSNMGTCSQNC